MLADLRYAWRQIRKHRGFTAVVVLTLAIGIGATTTAFSAINALLLRGLPVRRPEELVLISRAGAHVQPGAAYSFTFQLYERLRTQAKAIGEFIAVSDTARELVATGFGGSQPELVRTCQVSGNFFSFFGLSPALGRLLAPSDDQAGAARPVAVLGYNYWHSRFAASQDVLGKSVQIGTVNFTIVGVAPRGFTSLWVGGDENLWIPLQMTTQLDPDAQARMLPISQSNWLGILGRLAPGANRGQAESEAQVLYRGWQNDLTAVRGSRWSAAQRKVFLDDRLELEPGGSGFTAFRTIRPMAGILSTIVALVFIVACANVCSLLLARGSARQGEFGIRLALGASRGRLVRQLLVETLVLSLAGGFFGLLLTRWGIQFLVSFIPTGTSFSLDLKPDGHVLIFMILASAVTGIAVGLIPALRFSRQDLMSVLKDQGRSNAGGSRQFLNRALVLAQIMVTVCLIAGAGLFSRTLHKLQSVDPGFERRHTLYAYVDFDRKYGSVRRLPLFNRILAEFRGMPGIQAATVGWGGLATGGVAASQIPFTIQGSDGNNGELLTAYLATVGPGYFSTLEIPIQRGRALDERDTQTIPGPDSAPVPAVISEALVRRYFGNADPLGKVIQLSRGSQIPMLQVVGIAGDTKFLSLREDPSPEIYLPYGASTVAPTTRTSFVLRAGGNPLAVAAGLLPVLQRIDQRLLLTHVDTIDDFLQSSLVQERMIADLASFFGVLALALASIGLYGLLAYNVARRTREIGIRIALGAGLRNIVTLVVGQGLLVSSAGCLAGMASAAFLARAVASRLYGVGTVDPLTFAGTASLLIVVTLIASWIPARRASQIDPMIALRAE